MKEGILHSGISHAINGKEKVKIMPIQLAVSDLDGTLLHDDKTLDTNILEVKEKLPFPFTVCSGRNVFAMQAVLDQIKPGIPYIANNGASIFEDGKLIWKQAIDHQDVLKAVEYLIENEVPFLAYEVNGVSYFGTNPKLEAFKNRLIGRCDVWPVEKDKLEEDQILKLAVICPDQAKLEKAAEDIEKLCHNSVFVKSEDAVYSLSHQDATKGKAVEWVAQKLGIDPENVIVFGDNDNDISMFEAAGTAVAVADALDDVKAHADYVTLSNNQDGVSDFLKQYVS
jgi:Cof subfamily protein (haloacid dehalogenase superfamily)